MQAENFFKNFVAEWKENTRVQIGSIIIVLLLGILLIMFSREISLEKKNLLKGEWAELADVLAIESKEVWEERDSAQLQELVSLRTLIWNAQSDSKLMVSVQSRLLRICNNVGITRPQVKIGEMETSLSFSVLWSQVMKSSFLKSFLLRRARIRESGEGLN